MIEATNKDREVDEAIHALKLVVVSATLCFIDDDARLPLRNRTTAVLVDGSRMSFLAVGAARRGQEVRQVRRYRQGSSRPSESALLPLCAG